MTRLRSKTSDSRRRGSDASSNNKLEQQQKKFREAGRAMKAVTVNQEMVIKTLKTKAQQRRKDIKQRDDYIAQLEQKIESFRTTEKMLKKSKGDNDLSVKLKELQVACDKAQSRNSDLEEMLDEKDAQIEAIQKKQKSMLTPSLQAMKKHNKNGDAASESGSLGSGQSGSTAGEFEVARLRKELAKKKDKIVKMEMDFEMMQDELYDLKQKRNNSNGDGFGSGGAAIFFPPGNNFMLGNPKHLLGRGNGADDWSEADETDCESEFGESFFGGDGGGDGDQEGDGDGDGDDDFW